jgi:predicted dehydrogenase
MARAKFAVIGGGWRAEFYLRLAAALPDQLAVSSVVVRREDAAAELGERWNVPTTTSFESLRSTGADFVVTSVPPAQTAEVVRAAVDAGFPVLAETPPATDVQGLRLLWSQVGARNRVQVAEQYLQLPPHAARAELVKRGLIGEPTSVQVSSTHGYHAVSIIRGLVGAGCEPVAVDARRFTAPLIDPLTRSGWTGDEQPKDAVTTVATLDFGGRSGLYDFTDNQWHNQLRFRRLVIRGTRGEISGEDVVHLSDRRTIVRSTLLRRQTGYDLDLDGFDTQHISLGGDVLYRNPFEGKRFADEEIAIATLLVQMAHWCREESPPPYPLAQACQDQLISLAIEKAAQTGQTVTTSVEAWAGS